jgi:hypothetical protein
VRQKFLPFFHLFSAASSSGITAAAINCVGVSQNLAGWYPIGLHRVEAYLPSATF